MSLLQVGYVVGHFEITTGGEVDRRAQVAAGYRLPNTIVTVDATDFRPGMTGGHVRADATVTVSLAGISIFGPLAITLHHQHVEPVDPYRNVRP